MIGRHGRGYPLGRAVIGRGLAVTGMGVPGRRMVGMILLLHGAVVHPAMILRPGRQGAGSEQQRGQANRRLHAASPAYRTVTTRIIPVCMCISIWQ
ncbi:hypothetical protein GCM10019071_40060 [Sphingobium fuliginis]|uniref:Uncharacterized protein n=1 Tax=Sphingobium fuliginis (strain ATCC 27551) TaxID=336203 RepID=A0ABQ1FCT6_SPHSA|nr:hypothetical protein GCM10019071_40060 [Sphingobium fuliginis]